MIIKSPVWLWNMLLMNDSKPEIYYNSSLHHDHCQILWPLVAWYVVNILHVQKWTSSSDQIRWSQQSLQAMSSIWSGQDQHNIKFVFKLAYFSKFSIPKKCWNFWKQRLPEVDSCFLDVGLSSVLEVGANFLLMNDIKVFPFPRNKLASGNNVAGCILLPL